MNNITGKVRTAFEGRRVDLRAVENCYRSFDTEAEPRDQSGVKLYTKVVQ